MTKYEEDTIRFNQISKLLRKCKCGHTFLISPKKSKDICSWCGRTVYRNNTEEFKTKLKRLGIGE